MPTHHLLRGVALWALKGLYDPPENGLVAAKSTGTTVVEVGDYQITEPLANQIVSLSMRLVLQCYPIVPADLEASLKLAQRFGAVMVNVHAASGNMSYEDSVELMAGMVGVASGYPVPVVFETHRGRITQDLVRTAQMCKVIEGLRINLDVSHYVLAGELFGPQQNLAAWMDPVISKTAMVHGRISNGQQIQVDIIDPNDTLPQLYRQFWSEVMRRWRLESPVGSTLIFTPELGPPPYAITTANGQELSDRSDQSNLIWALAQQAWKDSARAAERLW